MIITKRWIEEGKALKKYSAIIFLFALIVISTTICKGEPVARNDASDPVREAIIEVIEESYIEGMFNDVSAEKIKKGWYPSCEIAVFMEAGDTCIKVPVTSFIRMAESGNTPQNLPKVSAKYPFIHIRGNAAIAVVEVYSEGKQLYTDFMNLYRFSDGWKIVGKTFYTEAGQ